MTPFRPFTLVVVVALFQGCASTSAEHVELPVAVALQQSVPSEKGDSLWPALVTSLVATVASGGRAVVFPLVALQGTSVLFQAATPGQAPEKADESFRIVRHNKSAGDERAESEKLAKDLSKLCPDFPPKVVTMANGTALVERESTNCLQPGYRLAIVRFLKGAEGMYQATYLARRERPSESSLDAWRTLLSTAKVVP